MKFALIKILITLLTFLIGVGASFCWNILSTEPQVEVLNESIFEPKPTQTSVCQLLDEPDIFDEKLVSFKATVYVIYDGTVILYPTECYSHGDNLWLPELEFDSYKGTNNNLKSLLEGTKLTSRDDFMEVDVEVIGIAKIIFKEGFKGYLITPKNLRIISPFRKFEPKGAA